MLIKFGAGRMYHSQQFMDWVERKLGEEIEDGAIKAETALELGIMDEYEIATDHNLMLLEIQLEFEDWKRQAVVEWGEA